MYNCKSFRRETFTRNKRQKQKTFDFHDSEPVTDSDEEEKSAKQFKSVVGSVQPLAKCIKKLILFNFITFSIVIFIKILL